MTARATLGAEGNASTLSGSSHGFHDSCNLPEVGQAGRVEDVRARIAVRGEALDRVVEVVDAADVVFGAAGEDERLALRARGLRGFRDTLCRRGDFVHSPRLGVEVLDRETGGSGVRQQLDRAGHASGITRVAALAVDVQREFGRGSDRGDMSNELVTRHSLIEPAQRPGKASAGRRQGLESRGREEPCRACIPGIRHDEELLALVKRPEGGALFGGRRAHSGE